MRGGPPTRERQATPPMSLSYADALAAVQGRGRFGVRLGLGRTRAILRAMGDPQLAFRGALVAGTNGKGSVLALAGAALREAGLRAGETPKPHLVTYRERLRVGGRLVSARTFARLVEEALPVVDGVARRRGEPTEFEVLTALAYQWFADARVDHALIEVGLGGRLDATHAWDGGVAAIVNVDLDHTAYLGPTVAAIAREKAAIVMRGDRAVTGATGEALAVIRRRARRVGARLAVVEPAPLVAIDRDGIVADAVLDALEAAGIARVDAGARRRGYAAARWPGRLELVTAATRGGPRDVLLDGAHNPAGAAVLAAALEDLRPGLSGWDARRPAPVTLVTGAMGDKDVAGIAGSLAASPALAGARVVCTSVPESRAMPAPDLAAAWRSVAPGVDVTVRSEPRAALEAALADGEGPVVVAGSLYLVGAVRPLLVDDPEIADPDDPAVAPVVRPWAT
jgi:dihydrofolate synthase/folylpolyglutamate synthase